MVFRIVDAANMEFEDSSFDAVCSYDLLEHVADVPRVLQEMVRVSKRMVIIFTPNHLDPVQHLRWQAKKAYRPWEVPSKHMALYAAVRMSFIGLTKAAGLNSKIYYLDPVLSQDEEVCGADYDATWLSNWFDIENILRGLGLSLRQVNYSRYVGGEDQVLRCMRRLKCPGKICSFYTKLRKNPCVIVGVKE